MGLPFLEPFASGAGVLANPPWTQAALVAQTLNYDGSGSGKASAVGTNEVFAYDNSNIYNGDQYAQLTIAGGLAAGTNYAEIAVRCQSTGGTFKAYTLFTDGTSGTGHTAIDRWTAGAGSEILAIATTFTTGDVMRLEVRGTVVSAYKNGVLLGSFNDSATPVLGGAPGCAVFNSGSNTVLIDNFEGGDLSVLAGFGGTRRAFGGRGRVRALNSPSGPFDQRGFLKQRLWDYTLIAAVVGAVTIQPDVGVLQLDGFAPTIGTPVTVTPGTGQLTLTGNAPTFPTVLIPGVGSLTLSGFAPTLGVPKTIVPGFGQLTLTGLAPTFPRTILPGSGSLTLTGQAPTIPRTILPGSGGLVLNGQAPSFSFAAGSFTLQPGLGSLTLTGLAPTFGFPKTVVPGTGLLVLTGQAPLIGVPVTLRPGLGALVLSGLAPSITFTPAGTFITPGTGQLILTGYAPTFGTFTFRIAGGPAMVATITAQGVLVASISGGPTFTSGIGGGPV